MNLTDHFPQLESLESSSPIITRAVAAGLHGQFSVSYQFTAWQRAALRFLGLFPQNVARFVISRFETLRGLDPALFRNFSVNRLAEERLRDYASLDGEKFPAITIGAALGGASTHLALALGGPFLPQAFVTTLRGGSPDGDVQIYFEKSAELAQHIAHSNPHILTIQHYDPVHDEWMTRYVNHLRFKLLKLPPAYIDFIRQYLEPGGAVCYLDCGAQWLRYRISERSVFQVGGWGDITPEEFLQGSERLQHYCRSVGLHHCNWRLEGFPLEHGPESEWGCEPGLGEALQEFCHLEGYRFVRIALPHPHDYSRLAYDSVARLLQKEGREPAGTFIEMFSQFDATAVQLSGLLPHWLVFNTRDSLAFLQEMRSYFPEDKPVFFSPLSSFTNTPDLVPWQDWDSALKGMDWINVGSRSSHYPADALALTNWSAALRQWVDQHRYPIQTRLPAEELLALSDNINPNTVSGLWESL